MRATKAKGNTEKQMLVDTNGLQEMLCAGRPAAVKIGTDAGARVQSGRRVFWNVRKVQQYIDAISEQEAGNEQEKNYYVWRLLGADTAV